MRPVQKVLTTILWGLATLAMVSVIGAGLWRREAGERELPVFAQVPDFSLVNQNGLQITRQTLEGRPWLADFIFTRCGGPCPLMTRKMSALQHALAPEMQFVSFSVDPDNDTPAVLKAYAQANQADESRWHFLTGPKDAVFAQARGMLLSALPADETNPIIHDERFLLIDASGQIRGAYHSSNADEMEQLEVDAKRLARESS